MGMKKCPFCAEEIQAEAVKCRYCGEMLSGRETNNSGPSDAQKPTPTQDSLSVHGIMWRLFAVFVGVCISFLTICHPSGSETEPVVQGKDSPSSKKVLTTAAMAQQKEQEKQKERDRAEAKAAAERERLGSAPLQEQLEKKRLEAMTADQRRRREALQAQARAISETWEYKLATINAGTYVPEDHVTIVRFRYLLDALERKTTNSRQQISDMSVACVEKLRTECGVRVKLLDLMEDANRSIPGDVRVDYASALSAYVVLKYLK